MVYFPILQLCRFYFMVFTFITVITLRVNVFLPVLGNESFIFKFVFCTFISNLEFLSYYEAALPQLFSRPTGCSN